MFFAWSWSAFTAPSLDQTFPKRERLCSQKIIKELFAKGSSVYLYPFRILYIPASTADVSPLPQVLFTVPKRAFKKAVDRNRIRRRIREAYRQHKASLLAQSEKKNPTFLAFIYIAKEEISFDIIEKKLILALKRLPWFSLSKDFLSAFLSFSYFWID